MIRYVALLGAFVFVLYLYRADFAKYSVFTMGVFKRVTRKPSDAKAECMESLCESKVTNGEVRIASKEIVVFGSVLIRYGSVKNHYCSEHTSFEFRNKEYKPSTVERLNETVVEAIAHFSVWITTDVEQRNDPFSDVQQSVNSTWNLMGVAFIVLLMSAMIMFAKGIGVGVNND